MKLTYYCMFCKRQCNVGVATDWVYCITCRTSFDIFYGTYEVRRIFMDCIINDKCYQLQLDYIFKTSAIVILPDKTDDTIVMVTSFPFVLKNVTPENISNKIRTSVVFS